ncbi:hypothetical protein E4U54_005683, partial [Claviceps lovelessii]
MANLNAWNPFSRRESHSGSSIVTYKILTLLTWLLSVIVSVYYVLHAPKDGFTIRRRIWDQNDLYPTAFTMSPVLGDIYWYVFALPPFASRVLTTITRVVLFILQLGYITHLFSRKQEVVNWAASVGSHFILNNLFHFAFVMLFVRSHFIWAEIILILNFINLSTLYFRHNTSPRFIHVPVASGPLAWTFVAIYWNGALMVHHPHNLVARIFGNIFIWSILAYGAFFIVAFK